MVLLESSGLRDRELQAKTNSTLNKLRKITLSGVLGKMLRAKTNGLRFRESMDQGKINLLDLSELSSDEKKLIGSICLTFAELAGKVELIRQLPNDISCHIIL